MRQAFLALFACLALSACQISDFAEPEELQAIEMADLEYQAAVLALEQTEDEVEERKDVFAEAVKSGDSETAKAAWEELEALTDSYESQIEEAREAAARADELERAVRAEEESVIRDLVTRFDPTGGLLAGFLVGPAIGLIFKRSRRRATEMLAYTVKGQLADAIKSFARALGWQHSDDTPHELLARAKKLAQEQGDIPTALAVDRFFATTDTTPQA